MQRITALVLDHVDMNRPINRVNKISQHDLISVKLFFSLSMQSWQWRNQNKSTSQQLPIQNMNKHKSFTYNFNFTVFSTESDIPVQSVGRKPVNLTLV